MTRPRITASLKGSLGELYYKELCDQAGWAYISLENIHKSQNQDVLEFKKGFNRVQVKIPSQIKPEIYKIANPSNNWSNRPSFVFDYLVCKVGNYDSYPDVWNVKEFCWAEVKTGQGIFSENQYKALFEIKLPIAVFHIADILEKPFFIDMDWVIMSGKDILKKFNQNIFSKYGVSIGIMALSSHVQED
ncbi:hypothetical protein SCCGRSA3_02560, partial [Marine Group I thaumarchaeote SCGC RSA3]